MSHTALIVVDFQNDFCPGGSLPVPNGDEIGPVLQHLVPMFERVVWTQDWHPANHVSFASQHPGQKAFTQLKKEDGSVQDLWPDHCIAHSHGAELHPSAPVKEHHLKIRKGKHQEVDSYSGFGAVDKDDEYTGLEGWLKREKVTKVYIAGLALEYCVAETAKDAYRYGFETCVILPATRGIGEGIEKQMNEMLKMGIHVISEEEMDKIGHFD